MDNHEVESTPLVRPTQEPAADHHHPPSARPSRTFATAAAVTVASLLFAGGYAALSSGASRSPHLMLRKDTDDQEAFVVADPSQDPQDPTEEIADGEDPDTDIGGDVVGEDPDEEVPGALDVDVLSMKIDSDYTLRGDSAPGTDYPWMTYILEPYRIHYVSAVNGGDQSSFVWTFDGQTKTGSSIDVKCKNPDKFYEIVVTEYDSNGAKMNSTSLSAMCKYVRREIRTLTDDDRTAYFDAMEILYKEPTQKGREKYGPQYKSAEDFIIIHNTNSGHLDCDHLHGGLGFLPQHAAMTLNFERSLQSVNPIVTMPYWDYTIEGHAMIMMNNSIEAWYLSRLWEDDWFGHYSPNGYAVDGGRFAYLPIKQDAWKVSTVTNSYGLMRSPWNNNKIPYLTRHDKSYGFYTKEDIVPTCYNHWDQMNMAIWSQFGSSIQYSPHGSLHILAGGTWGADYRHYMASQLDYKLKRAQPLGTVTMARIWRKGWMTFPKMCSIDTPVNKCKGVCKDLQKWIDGNETYTMLDNMYPGLASAKHFLTDDHGNDISEFILRMLCNDDDTLNPQIGEFMESASPSDPIFWPTHPTLDRLWHWRKISGFSQEDWYNSSCWGHNYDDVALWHIDLDETSTTQYTVGDLMAAFDPMMVEVPYIYDNFEWPHCEEEGYPLQLISSFPQPNGDPIDVDSIAQFNINRPSDPDNYLFLNWETADREHDAGAADGEAAVPM